MTRTSPGCESNATSSMATGITRFPVNSLHRLWLIRVRPQYVAQIHKVISLRLLRKRVALETTWSAASARAPGGAVPLGASTRVSALSPAPEPTLADLERLHPEGDSVAQDDQVLQALEG